MANLDFVDVAAPARNAIRWLLTVGAAALYAVIVLKVSVAVWAKSGNPSGNTILAGVMNSISLTFGSAFVGWFGLSAQSAHVTVERESDASQGLYAALVIRGLFTQLAGAAVMAMLVYLVVGAIAGVTYIFNVSATPTALVTVATAWAAQASAVVASTLSAVLRAERRRQ